MRYIKGKSEIMTRIKKDTLNDCLTDANLLEEALFVLQHGNVYEIQSCASLGARVLLPNMMMGHSLIMKTIIREARKTIVISEMLWEQMKDAFTSETMIHPDLVIYKHLN